MIGMDLCSTRFPNMKSFKHWLLTGQPLEEAHPAGLAHGGNTSPNENRLQVILARACRDAGMPQPDESGRYVPVALHLPAQVARQGENMPALPSQQVVVIRDSFLDALDSALSMLEDPACEAVALCGYYPDLHPPAAAGVACMLLARQASGVPAYACLDRDPELLNETSAKALRSAGEKQEAEASISELPPILELMRGALSLNSQTHFPEYPIRAEEKILPDARAQACLRPWFPQPFAQEREMRVDVPDQQHQTEGIRLEKEYTDPNHPERPFDNYAAYLLPVDFQDEQQIGARIKEIKQEIAACHDLPDYINSALSDFQTRKRGAFTLAILGSSRQELTAELEHARNGLPQSIESGKDWQTPVGSYFSPRPFGPHEKIAFMYPGAFGTYVGMGREIFYLFPQVQDALLTLTSDPGCAINETEIFPQRLTSSIREQLQNKLNNNPTQMISSGVCFSYLFTIILRDIFKVKPDVAFGYSLGENSMMFAMGVWTQADAMRTSLEASPIFHTRVSGQQNAIREFWKMPIENGENSNSSIWANYVLMAPFEKVRAAIQNEERVYITHINTPRQVVIGGEKNACKRVVDNIQCMHLQAPYHHSIHCEPIASEFDAFMRLHDWPVENKPDIPIYTAADYAPLQYDSKSIAKSFAKMLTNPIDFPRLVNLAYEDGARIFIELGAGNNCSKWVEATLKEKPHTTMSINQNNVDDHVSILKLLARLISHQIPVDLKALIGNSYGYQNE